MSTADGHATVAAAIPIRTEHVFCCIQVSWVCRTRKYAVNPAWCALKHNHDAMKQNYSNADIWAVQLWRQHPGAAPASVQLCNATVVIEHVCS